MGRSVVRIGCHRAKGARRRTPSQLEFMSRPGFRKDPGLFVSRGSFDPPNLCPTGAHRGAMHLGLLFNKLPRDALPLWVPASRTQADVAQLAERDHAMVEASGSNPGIRSRHLMAGVLRHNGHACAPQSAGAARMCAAGTPASCSESALWRISSALALEHNRDEISWTPKQASSSSRFEAEIGRNDWAAPEPVTGKHSLR